MHITLGSQAIGGIMRQINGNGSRPKLKEADERDSLSMRHVVLNYVRQLACLVTPGSGVALKRALTAARTIGQVFAIIDT